MPFICKIRMLRQKIPSSQLLKVAIHACVVTLLAVVLSYTIIYSFTSMLAFKSSVEVKDYQLSDLYSVVADKSSPRILSENVVLVAVDGLPRDSIAEVLEIVKGAHPKSIGLDIIFEHQYDGDSAIIEISSDPCVVMAERFAVNEDYAIHKSYFCDDAHASKCGFTNVEQGVVRRYRTTFDINGTRKSSFAFEVAKISGFDTELMNCEESYIYYPAHDFRCIDFWMLTEHRERCREIMKDKIVLIGDKEDIHDMHQTPLGLMSGLQIQATIIETIVKKNHIRHASGTISWMIAVLSCLLFVSLNLFLSKKNLATGKLLFRLAQILILYLYFWIGCVLFAKSHIYIDFAPALSMIAIGLLAYDIYFGILALFQRVRFKLKKSKS